MNHEIFRVIDRQFRSLSWGLSKTPQWDMFLEDFEETALLYPSSRPVKPLTPQQFVDRMDNLRESGTLHTFKEKIVFCKIQVYGNVASASVGCEMTENHTYTTYDVSVINLVHDNRWTIASQAWSAIDKKHCQPANATGFPVD